MCVSGYQLFTLHEKRLSPAFRSVSPLTRTDRGASHVFLLDAVRIVHCSAVCVCVCGFFQGDLL